MSEESFPLHSTKSCVIDDERNDEQGRAMKQEPGKTRKQKKTCTGKDKTACGTLSYLAECRGMAKNREAARDAAPDDMRKITRSYPSAQYQGWFVYPPFSSKEC
jgi:hypothetical protein